ncbi:conserved hypothetical protein [Candida albicans WO-1]|uniref:Uncharacterized protein n=1 Tax=Candida albicans (strain WO-1) TaxID=294748 RepID=C4YPK9_CANAW|nr:conserved hypothetical protein [Candida albicans WO-1]
MLSVMETHKYHHLSATFHHQCQICHHRYHLTQWVFPLLVPFHILLFTKGIFLLHQLILLHSVITNLLTRFHQCHPQHLQLSRNHKYQHQRQYQYQHYNLTNHNPRLCGIHYIHHLLDCHLVNNNCKQYTHQPNQRNCHYYHNRDHLNRNPHSQ